MDFIDKIKGQADRIPQVAATLTTEESTKNALIMPFIQSILGYDVFNPVEVVPEFNADTGTKKGEKVDYAIMKDGEVQIIIECKKHGEKLNAGHANQLFRYFSVTKTRIAILTNGTDYLFFTDLDSANVMDDTPFLTLNMAELDDHLVAEVKKLTKDSFDLDSILSAAGDLKYLNSIKKIIAEQFVNPDENFVKFFASKVYNKPITAKVKSQFQDITARALKRFLNDSINDRLKNAMGGSSQVSLPEPQQEDVAQNKVQAEEEDSKSKVNTTMEEIEGFNVVKAILRQVVDIKRVIARDTQSYFGVLLDDNNRKPLCRLRFNGRQKTLCVIDNDKNEIRYPIDSIDDIFNYTEQLQKTVKLYEGVVDTSIEVEPQDAEGSVPTIAD